jgi:hypothetical protein
MVTNFKNIETMKRYNRNPPKGRPQLPADERKSIVVPVKYSPDKYMVMIDQANIAGLNRSEYIRQSSLNCKIIERLKPKDVKAIRDLQGIAENVNRIAKFCSSILNRGSTNQNLVQIFRDMIECKEFILSLIKIYRNTPDSV